MTQSERGESPRARYSRSRRLGEGQGRHREVGSGGSPIQTRGATHRNRIRGVGPPGTSGHVTAKSSIRNGVCFINPASTRQTFCALPWEICRLSRRGTEGGGSRPDRSAEVSRGQSRSEAGKASEAPQGRKAGQQIGQAASPRTEGPNGTPRGEGRRGAVASCRAAVGHPSGS